MYPSTSVTINRKFVCIVSMYFWSSSLVSNIRKLKKTVVILFPWNVLAISFSRDIYFFNRDLPISRYCNQIKIGITIFNIIVLSPKLVVLFHEYEYDYRKMYSSTCGVSWPSGLVHWTQVLALPECEFESQPGRSRRLCPWARHLTTIASSFGWDVKL